MSKSAPEFDFLRTDPLPGCAPAYRRAAVKLGLTPLRAIQSATVNAADLLGWQDRVGTLEAGKYADLVTVSGDPLEEVSVLENVKAVIKRG
jgi:imidazolonepropionase-like amidohydrolase